jgi:hypothetical protein
MEYKIVPIAPKQEPIRLVKLSLNLNEKCRKAEVSDYVAYTILHIGETSLGNWLKTEEEKPLKQWNWGAVVFGEILKLGCNLAKGEVNKNLCNPIGNN